MASPSGPGQVLSALPASPTLAAAQQFTALADIAALLRSDNDAVVGSGVRHIFEHRPMPGLTCSLGPGSTGDDAARMIGGLTITTPVPFTKIIEWATRERARMTPVPGTQGYRHLDPGDPADQALAGTLGLAAGDRVWGRQAFMEAGRLTAATTAATLNPELIPSGPMRMIEAGCPIGTALEGFTMQRTEPAVKVAWPADPGLLLSAVITVGGKVAGFTSEEVPCTLLDRLAKTAAG